MSVNQMYQHKPTKVGIGIGAFGVAFTFLTTALLVLVPQEVMAPAASSAYIDTWSRPIMAIGNGVLSYGIPLLSAAFAYYLMVKSHPAKSVVKGFIIGGFVFVLGDALLAVTVTHFFAEGTVDSLLFSHVYRNLTLGGRLIGGALIGTLGATIVKVRF